MLSFFMSEKLIHTLSTAVNGMLKSYPQILKSVDKSILCV